VIWCQPGLISGMCSGVTSDRRGSWKPTSNFLLLPRRNEQSFLYWKVYEMWKFKRDENFSSGLLGCRLIEIYCPRHRGCIFVQSLTATHRLRNAMIQRTRTYLQEEFLNGSFFLRQS
jgi:hypothetical protein